MKRALLQAGAACVLLLAFVAVTADVEMYGWLTRQGHQFTRQALDDRSQTLVTTMHVVTAFGGGFVLAGVALLAGLAFAYWRRDWTPLLFLAVTLGGIKAITSALKVITARARPPADVGVYVEPTYAYPSGHTTATTVLCVALALLVTASMRSRPARAAVWIAAAAVSAVMGVSRIVLGVHWPTDVLGGWLLALAWTLLCLAAWRAIGVHYDTVLPAPSPLSRRR